MKEVSYLRVAGPFNEIPFDDYIQSPIGLVPKVGGDQTRLIFHLSYDFKEEGLKSVNFHTPRSICTVKYRDFDYAVSMFLDLYGEMFDQEEVQHNQQNHADNTKFRDKQQSKKWKSKFFNYKQIHQPIYSGKSDLKCAFCILGLILKCWKWLVMKARDPTSGIWKYFIDKCLPFGSSRSCALFQKFSDALRHLIEFRLKVNKRVTNYLDNFLFIAYTLSLCNEMIQRFLDLCAEIGVPVSMEKTE